LPNADRLGIRVKGREDRKPQVPLAGAELGSRAIGQRLKLELLLAVHGRFPTPVRAGSGSTGASQRTTPSGRRAPSESGIISGSESAGLVTAWPTQTRWPYSDFANLGCERVSLRVPVAGVRFPNGSARVRSGPKGVQRSL